MALLPEVFHPENEEEDPFAPIDADWYLAEIIKSSLEATKDKTGKYISLCFKILEGDREGRFIYTNINIVNNSDTAVRIGKADLKRICMACGIDGELEDTEDLHNIPMYIKVTVKPANAQWPAKNEIKNYKSEEAYTEMLDKEEVI